MLFRVFSEKSLHLRLFPSSKAPRSHYGCSLRSTRKVKTSLFLSLFVSLSLSLSLFLFSALWTHPPQGRFLTSNVSIVGGMHNRIYSNSDESEVDRGSIWTIHTNCLVSFSCVRLANNPFRLQST
jgi:hypothetical protein